jgi:hypothetical protein
MKPKPNAAALTKTLLLTLVLTSGCQSHVRLQNSQRLMARQDFPQAASAAPEWVRDSLKTINALELELERK